MELYHHPANKFVAGFIGSPQMNFIPGKVEKSGREGLTVRLDEGDSVVALVANDGIPIGTKVEVGIRPEHVKLTNDGAGIEGVVDFVEQLGDSQFAYVRIPGNHVLTARMDGNVNIAVNGTLRVELPPADNHVFLEADGASLKRLDEANISNQPVLGVVE